MTPQGSRHATGVDLVADSLRHAFRTGFHVRMQLPLAIDDYSEPEPDVAVVKGQIRNYRDAHPTSSLLVVEVSDDSLRHDRTVKQRLYARCGIPEYWILDPRSSILDPRSSILDPRSSILDPRSSILDPRSSILDPRSSILDPRSSILDPRSSPFPMPVWRSTAIQPKTAIVPSPSTGPVTPSRRSLALRRGSPSTICFPDSESQLIFPQSTRPTSAGSWNLWPSCDAPGPAALAASD